LLQPGSSTRRSRPGTARPWTGGWSAPSRKKRDWDGSASWSATRRAGAPFYRW